MTFAAHGVIGAGICAIPFVRCKPWIKWSAAAFGFLGGIAPDAADFIAWVFGAERWVLYSRMHSGDLVQYFIYHPAYALHLVLDSIIHRVPAYDWWADYYWIEIGCWVFGAALLWEVFRHRDP